MTDEEFATIIGAWDQQLVHAQACLDLFEKDRGRCAGSALEIRNWADVQEPENLRFRILRRVRAGEVWTRACRQIWNDVPPPLASRPPIGQRIFLTLAEAASASGASEAAILAAIAAGRIAGMKDMQRVWHVERADLCRVFAGAALASEASGQRRLSTSARSDRGDARPLDAATLVLEVGIATLVRQAGDRLRRRAVPWRRAR
jgi:hypothetical protein